MRAERGCELLNFKRLGQCIEATKKTGYLTTTKRVVIIYQFLNKIYFIVRILMTFRLVVQSYSSRIVKVLNREFILGTPQSERVHTKEYCCYYHLEQFFSFTLSQLLVELLKI